MPKFNDPPLECQRLREVLDYNRNTGIFRWKEPSNNRVKKGGIAGSKDPSGYCKIMVDKKRCFAHRLAWLYVYGMWPHSIIDHVNGKKDDNRIANLRIADWSLNRANAVVNSNSVSGCKGVVWSDRAKCWYANITIGGKYVHLGCFKSFDAARLARATYARKTFGEFARETWR